MTVGTGITTAASAYPAPSSGTTSDDPGSTSSSGPEQTTAPATTDLSTTSASDSTTSTTTTPEITTAGDHPEYIMFADPLIDSTLGTQVGGEFVPTGWRVIEKADRVFWEIPRLVKGSVAFTMSNVNLDSLPLNDHEVFAMYEGGYDIEHPIGYNPGFRNNAFKSMIRIYGHDEGDRVGQQKLMWGMCPLGAPGYHEGTCPCTQPAGFFEEPVGGHGGWDGSPQRFKIEWADGTTRLFRNDEEVVSVDWSTSGMSFGPDSLYISLGNPRPLDVEMAGMPIGAIFSDLVVEGWTGPPTPTCAL